MESLEYLVVFLSWPITVLVLYFLLRKKRWNRFVKSLVCVGGGFLFTVIFWPIVFVMGPYLINSFYPIAVASTITPSVSTLAITTPVVFRPSSTLYPGQSDKDHIATVYAELLSTPTNPGKLPQIVFDYYDTRTAAAKTTIARTPIPQPLQLTSRCAGGCIPHYDGCDIKGDIYPGTKEKIYFVPGSQYYSDVQIDTDSGERWFCTENEAQAAGWQRPGK
jgi:hypothetical protein